MGYEMMTSNSCITAKCPCPMKFFSRYFYKRMQITLGVLLLFSVFSTVSSNAQEQFEKDNLVIFSASGQAHKFKVELAVSPKQRSLGLMYRKTMPRDAGMLFTYETENNVMMWMKNTDLPLDMLFLNTAGKIVYIQENTTPHSTKTISSGQNVIGVLELNAGTVFQLGIKIGDIVHHRSLQK